MPWVSTAFFLEFMPNLHIFNPETDLALGVGRDSYTPNKLIREFRSNYSLIPAIFADKGDTILVLDSEVDKHVERPFSDLVAVKNISIVDSDQLKNMSIDFQQILPWGWNRHILRLLSSIDCVRNSLPAKTKIETLRNISHRKTTVSFFTEYGNHYPGIESPRYACDLADAMRCAELSEGVCFKAPWSSSGRGVVFSDKMSHDALRKWVDGIIRNQKGVMVEPFYKRVADFASEWISSNEEAEFLGFSLFKSSERGKYKGNILLTQSEIRDLIFSFSKTSFGFLEHQKEFIEKFISPVYSGPLGFDMLVTEDSRVNPCVEINIRNTMGHVALHVSDIIHSSSEEKSEIRNILKRYFPDNFFSL